MITISRVLLPFEPLVQTEMEWNENGNMKQKKK